MSFGLYMLGVVILVGALAYGASRLGVSGTWIAVGVLAVIGLGLMGAVVKTRNRDPS